MFLVPLSQPHTENYIPHILLRYQGCTRVHWLYTGCTLTIYHYEIPTLCLWIQRIVLEDKNMYFMF